MLGIAVGVWALVVVLAFQSGMEQDLQNKILGGTAHINLMKEDEGAFDDPNAIVSRLQNLPHVKAAASTLYTTVMAEGKDSTHTAILKAVDLNASHDANEVYQTITVGSVDGLKPTESGEVGIILGKDLADDLGVKVGDPLKVISLTAGRLTPAGMAPRQKFFVVVGLFQSGLFEYDSTWGYISMEATQELVVNTQAANIVQMKVDDIYKVKEVGTSIIGALGPGYKTKDWQQLNQPVFAALNLQRLGFFVGIGLIILVAALNIITTLVMMVIEKNGDIAILMSMGATKRSILVIFMLQGLIIGFVGMAVGEVLGVTTSWFANTYRLITLDPRIYSISYVPFHIVPSDVLLVALLAVLISFLATIYPAWKASQLVPVESLRYE